MKAGADQSYNDNIFDLFHILKIVIWTICDFKNEQHRFQEENTVGWK